MNENENKSSNYELKSDAVEKLLDAQNGEVPDFTQEELDKYRRHKFTIPNVVKVMFIKAWFAGAVCFFILWGLPLYATLDQLFAAGAALGMVTDLLTNNILRFLEKTPGGNSCWLLCGRKGMVGLGLNLLGGFVIMLCVMCTYGLINNIGSAAGNAGQVTLAVEPLLFGLLCMGYEMLFIGVKRLLQNVIRDAKHTAQDQSST